MGSWNTTKSGELLGAHARPARPCLLTVYTPHHLSNKTTQFCKYSLHHSYYQRHYECTMLLEKAVKWSLINNSISCSCQSYRYINININNQSNICVICSMTIYCYRTIKHINIPILHSSFCSSLTQNRNVTFYWTCCTITILQSAVLDTALHCMLGHDNISVYRQDTNMKQWNSLLWKQSWTGTCTAQPRTV